MAKAPISVAPAEVATTSSANEVAIELLKEAGLCIRTSWILINNLVRSFLYLNLILFTIFGVSLRGFDVSSDITSNRTADQGQNSKADIKQNGSAQSVSKENENLGAQKTEIIKILSLVVCGLGILGPIFAGFLLISMINYGQNFLAAANKLEASILAEAKLDRTEFGFYGFMSKRYEASLLEWSSVKRTAPAIFALFAIAWIVMLLRALNIKYYIFGLG